MPIYEYECSKCDETIEVIQKMSDPALKKHQGCGGTLTKLLSVPAIRLKEDFGVPDSTAKHPSFQQQIHNERKNAERQRKSKPVITGGKKSRSQKSK